MGEPKLYGLMMDDYPLSLTALVERAERLTPGRTVVSRRPDGTLQRTTMGDCARRARRLAAALSQLGIEEGDRVGTLMWNQPEHLEAYYALPAMGAVVHTLNPRLHPDELSFIATDAEDRAIIVDETLLNVLASFRDAHEFEHVIVVSHSGESPEGTIEYERLLESASAPADWLEPHERRAAAICYTSGTTGKPKGVLYSHRALVLHSMAAALPGAMNVSTRVVVSGSTNTTDGIDLSELYIVENNLADIMTESFGTCEYFATDARLAGINAVAEQAAAQGITYFVSTGDSGAEGLR